MSRELCWPLRIDSAGGLAFVADVADVLRQRVTSAVATEPGERVMRPTYGTATQRYAFADMTPSDVDDLRESITTSVSTLVPEVTVFLVEIATPDATGQMPVSVHYRLTSGLEGTAKTSLTVGGTSGIGT